VKVEYVPSADYTASVDGFKNGDVLLCWFGGYTGLQARQAVPNARVIACGKVDKKFHSYFIANKSLGLEKSDKFPMALKGKKFTFGSASSTSGRLMPEYFIRKETWKIPAEFFGAEMSSGSRQDRRARRPGPSSGSPISSPSTASSRKKIDRTSAVIWVTPDYVDYHSARTRASRTFGRASRIAQAALVAITDPKLLEGMQRPDGLIAARNEDFIADGGAESGLIR
jgi:phosphonate transport system substrate-binding protein